MTQIQATRQHHGLGGVAQGMAHVEQGSSGSALVGIRLHYRELDFSRFAQPKGGLRPVTLMDLVPKRTARDPGLLDKFCPTLAPLAFGQGF